jgi:hypothetical protein
MIGTASLKGSSSTIDLYRGPSARDTSPECALTPVALCVRLVRELGVGWQVKSSWFSAPVDQITNRVPDHAGNQHCGEGFLCDILANILS